MVGKEEGATPPVNLMAQLGEHPGTGAAALDGSLVSVFLKALHVVKRSRQANKH